MARVRMSSRDIITLSLLVAMSAFFFVDQRIMTAIIKELSAEYGVSESVIGYIGSAFMLIGAAISIIFGYLTDKVSRKWLLVATVLIGEIPCLMTGFKVFTQTIESFTILRILTGIGIGGVYPICYSLIADYFREEHRPTATAWVNVAWMIGMVAGPVMAGFLTNTYGWRLPFLLAALPGFPTVLLFALYAKDPERGRTEAALEDLIRKGLTYKQKIKFSDFKVLVTNKTNIWMFLQSLPGTVPWGILGYWMIHFLEKSKGMSKEASTLVFLLLGGGAVVGGIVFAYIGEWLYKKNPKYLPILCGTFVLLGIIPAVALVNVPLGAGGIGQSAFYILSFVTGFMVAVATANAKAITMNVNRPEHRGSIFALYNISDNIGQGFGPAIGGALIGFGYTFMMNFALPFWVVCGAFLFVVARYITADRDALQKYLKDKAEEMKRKQ
jgi:MFS family permease